MQKKIQREANTIVDSVLGNIETFDYQVTFVRRRIFYDSLKQHMGIINKKLEGNDFVMSLMEQMSKIFSLSFQNKNF